MSKFHQEINEKLIEEFSKRLIIQRIRNIAPLAATAIASSILTLVVCSTIQNPYCPAVTPVQHKTLRMMVHAAAESAGQSRQETWRLLSNEIAIKKNGITACNYHKAVDVLAESYTQVPLMAEDSS